MNTWYRCGQSTFSSCNHVGRQRKAKIYKSTIGRKPQRIKFEADKNPIWENILILQQSRCTIPSSHDTVVDNQHSRHVIKWADRERPKWHKSTIGRKPKRIKVKAEKTPKRENILIFQQWRCTIPWSHDRGVDNQHSRHAIMWADREMPKSTKAP